MSHYYKVLVVSIILSLFFSCQKEQKTVVDKTVETNITATPKETIVLEPFTEYPEEIDGCSCTFASDADEHSKGKRIYVNDFGETAFVKIKGRLIKFTQFSHIKEDSLNTVARYKAKNYTMTVTAKNNGDTEEESNLMTGSIKIEDNKGNTTEQTFYGECGC